MLRSLKSFESSSVALRHWFPEVLTSLDVFTSLTCWLFSFCFPVKPEELYAFSYNPKMSKENREMGWKLIDLRLDYQRMGIPNDSWEITDINKDYEVIPAQRSRFRHCLLVVINGSSAAASGEERAHLFWVKAHHLDGELQIMMLQESCRVTSLCLIPLAREQSFVFLQKCQPIC